MSAGETAQPTPDGDDPDNPAASVNLRTTSTMDAASSPRDGGQGDNPVIPKPEF